MNRVRVVHPPPISFRIHCAPVNLIADEHLVLEVHHIAKVANMAKKKINMHGVDFLTNALECGGGKSFYMNKNNEYFFYNKGKYLFDRFFECKFELEKRGIFPGEHKLFP